MKDALYKWKVRRVLSKMGGLPVDPDLFHMHLEYGRHIWGMNPQTAVFFGIGMCWFADHHIHSGMSFEDALLAVEVGLTQYFTERPDMAHGVDVRKLHERMGVSAVNLVEAGERAHARGGA